jgi:hypothetical protein
MLSHTSPLTSMSVTAIHSDMTYLAIMMVYRVYFYMVDQVPDVLRVAADSSTPHFIES